MGSFAVTTLAEPARYNDEPNAERSGINNTRLNTILAANRNIAWFDSAINTSDDVDSHDDNHTELAVVPTMTPTFATIGVQTRPVIRKRGMSLHLLLHTMYTYVV